MSIAELARRIDGHQWQIGDALIAFRAAGGNYRMLEELLGKDAPDRRMLQRYRLTCEKFPTASREGEVPFTAYQIAAEQAQRWSIDAAEALIHVRNPDEELLAMIQDEGRRITSLSQGRDARRYFDALNRTRQRQAHAAAPKQKDADAILARCCHGCCVEFARTLAKFTVKLGELDPPYGDFGGDERGAYTTAGIYTGSGHCDNHTTEASLRATIDAIEAFAPALAPEGVLLLWQNYKVIRAPILEAIQKAGLVTYVPLIWRKTNPRPADFGAWGPSVEHCYVLTRPGVRLPNLDHSSRHQVLEFEPVRQTPFETHKFEKPLEMRRYFVNKLTQPGDLVVDAFGCTGGLAICAAQLGRQWHYVESNLENFRMGTKRILASLLPEVEAHRGPESAPPTAAETNGHDDCKTATEDTDD